MWAFRVFFGSVPVVEDGVEVLAGVGGVNCVVDGVEVGVVVGVFVGTDWLELGLDLESRVGLVCAKFEAGG